jgi:GAF domain-containing protein
VRLRLIAPVLLVLAATAGVFALTRMDTNADAWLVLASGLALAAVTATAIANAGTRRSRAQLADEQAALRRVATLVARESSPVEIFGAVTEEARRVVESDAVGLLRFEPDGTATLVAQSDTPWDPPPLGTRFTLDGENVVAQVLRTGEVARVDDWSGSTGSVAAMASVLGVRSAVASPVVVEGALWGTIIVATGRSESLPAETESRIAQFTGLVATAIANAEARGALSRLAEEQAALRRVAVLVARQPSPEEVFTAVAEAVGSVLGADASVLTVFQDDVAARVVASWSAGQPPVPVGTALPLDGDSAVARIFGSAAAARIDGYGQGPVADVARALAVRSSCGAPILIEGKLWGAVTAAMRGDNVLPEDAETRIAAFTELVATAVSNAQAREQITALAEEQAALRRVAELVATESPLADVLAGVARELAGVLGDVEWALARDDGDGMATALAVSDHNPTPAGTRVAIDTGSAFGRAIREGSPARIDDYFATAGDFGQIAREHGIRAAISCPIVVRGRTWGAMSVGRRNPDPLPPETESVVARFSDLVATAIANAEARAQVERLADEQAALRRIATLVAGGAAPEQVFAAVTEEIAATFDAVTAVMRFEHDDPPGRVLVGLSEEGDVPIGTRWPLADGMLSTEVYRTGRSVRIGDLDPVRRGVPAAGFRFGVPSQVACPIVVEGSLWGVITLNAERDLPPDTEQRLEKFIELVTTAIANAEAGIALRTAADEQGALRRVATLVAASAAPSDVFAAVTREIGLVTGADATVLCRADPDGQAVVVGTWTKSSSAPALGSRMARGGTNLVTLVLDTGRPARIDSYEDASGGASEVARAHGLRSAVGAPILVESRLWGLVIAGTTLDEPLPPDCEERLAAFTELVATAIANAQAHDDLTGLAELQAALRRVATLVARRVPPEEVFRAVAQEAGALLGADVSALVRLESDNTVTVVAGPPSGPHSPGDRLAIDPAFVVEAVRTTGRPARFETDDPSAEGMPEIVRRLGVRSAVASPIVVEEVLWGAVVLGSLGESFPAETEQRLDEFTELLATGISNATTRAELVASRARIVAAGDAERRRIERNLHDGTQQRLVSLGLAVRAAESNLPPDRDDLRAQLAGVATGLVAAVEDLQEISRGIHPAILSKGGLAPALRTLAHRSAIPVDLELAADVRLAEPIEVAAYFVASEALANAAKHSQASRIDVSVEQRDGRLRLSVRDDGIGGADAARGSGLVGLTDRVEALGGSLRVSSRPGEGTQVTAELPLEPRLSPATR